MSAPNLHQLRILEEAISLVRADDIRRYVALRRMFAERQPGFESKFRKEFSVFYGLNVGGLSAQFKDRYFEYLLGRSVAEYEDPYTPILKDLYGVPRLKGDRTLQCSFVSKLVATHDETRPLFDRYVGAFFGITVPSVGSIDFRIAGFVSNMERLHQLYGQWCDDGQVQAIRHAFIKRHPELVDCSTVRLIDFLVYAAGREWSQRVTGRRSSK